MAAPSHREQGTSWASCAQERLIWEGHPSWRDHALLFILIGAAGVRAVVAARSAEWSTAGLYVLAMAILFGIAAAFRYSVFYLITTHRIRIASGFGREHVEEFRRENLGRITIRSELWSGWLGIGSLVISPLDPSGERVLRGVPDPDRVLRELDLPPVSP